MLAFLCNHHSPCLSLIELCPPFIPLSYTIHAALLISSRILCLPLRLVGSSTVHFNSISDGNILPLSRHHQDAIYFWHSVRSGLSPLYPPLLPGMILWAHFPPFARLQHKEVIFLYSLPLTFPHQEWSWLLFPVVPQHAPMGSISLRALATYESHSFLLFALGFLF